MFSDASTVVIALFLLAPVLIGILFKLFSPGMRSVIDARMLTADEQVAFLEAAVITLHVEDLRQMSEEIGFRSFLRRAKWRIDVRKEMAAIRPRAVRALQNRLDLEAYLNGIKAKISSEKAADAILSACRELSESEGISRIEGRLLTELERTLRPDNEKARIGEE
ncbi:MAG: hypothetical protein OXU79_13110 [Gemmatimonadota bacterium]|nr:hypothetical protein [Gemmatimonadota bacterium]